MKQLICECGCESKAKYLCTGFEYDPKKPDKKGDKFIDEPCCYNAMCYLSESSDELGFPFEARSILYLENEKCSDA